MAEPDQHTIPGSYKLQRWKPRLHWELVACATSGHELIGIDAALLPRIFTTFEQGPQAIATDARQLHQQCLPARVELEAHLQLGDLGRPGASIRPVNFLRSASRSICRFAARRCATDTCCA